jgi:hypothetical protein
MNEERVDGRYSPQRERGRGSGSGAQNSYKDRKCVVGN